MAKLLNPLIFVFGAAASWPAPGQIESAIEFRPPAPAGKEWKLNRLTKLDLSRLDSSRAQFKQIISDTIKLLPLCRPSNPRKP